MRQVDRVGGEAHKEAMFDMPRPPLHHTARPLPCIRQICKDHGWTGVATVEEGGIAMLVIKFATCPVCGKWGMMQPKSKRCDNCKMMGYTVKRNPYRKKEAQHGQG